MTDAGCVRDALGWRGMVVVAGKKADVCSSVTMDEDPLEPSRLLPTRRFPICNDLVTGLDPSLYLNCISCAGVGTIRGWDGDA